MTMSWYNNKDNVIGLLDFLISAELITTTDEVIDYYQDLGAYTGVFVVYAKEILGIDIEINKIE